MGMCRNSGTRSERRLLKAARYFCLPLFLIRDQWSIERSRRKRRVWISQQRWAGQGKDGGKSRKKDRSRLGGAAVPHRLWPGDARGAAWWRSGCGDSERQGGAGGELHGSSPPLLNFYYSRSNTQRCCLVSMGGRQIPLHSSAVEGLTRRNPLLGSIKARYIKPLLVRLENGLCLHNTLLRMPSS